jgi:hypothetical protein
MSAFGGKADIKYNGLAISRMLCKVQPTEDDRGLWEKPYRRPPVTACYPPVWSVEDIGATSRNCERLFRDQSSVCQFGI